MGGKGLSPAVDTLEVGILALCVTSCTEQLWVGSVILASQTNTVIPCFLPQNNCAADYLVLCYVGHSYLMKFFCMIYCRHRNVIQGHYTSHLGFSVMPCLWYVNSLLYSVCFPNQATLHLSWKAVKLLMNFLFPLSYLPGLGSQWSRRSYLLNVYQRFDCRQMLIFIQTSCSPSP